MSAYLDGWTAIKNTSQQYDMLRHLPGQKDVYTKKFSVFFDEDNDKSNSAMVDMLLIRMNKEVE